MSDATIENTGNATKLRPDQRRAIVAGSIGNAVEWVDWAVYASFSSVFASQFFPKGNEVVALLSTLAIFAVGFVMRPIGGAILGAYADRRGRKKGLTLTISLMAGASFVIAIAPTYGAIGIAAPIILLLARLLQGFSAGGEFGTSSAFLVESAAPARRAFAGSWQQVSVGSGVLIASLMGAGLTAVLDQQALETWGWRLAFGIGGLLGLVGLWLRISVHETEHFVRMRDSGRPRVNPLRAMLVQHPKAALRVAGITIAGTLTYYVWISYMVGYAHAATGISLNEAFIANAIAVAVFLCMLPFGGVLSDKIGRKPTMTAFAVGFMLIAWPAFHFMNDNFWVLLGIELVGCVFLVGYSANWAAVMAEQFPAEVRTVGIGLPYALAVALFGGTAPYVTTWMASNGLQDQIYLYVIAAALVGVVVYLTMPETKGKELE